MQWGNPQALYWLMLIVPLGLLAYALVGWREKQLRRLMDEPVLAELMPRNRRYRRLGRLGLWLAAIALGLMALARPQWGEKWVEVRHMGLDILVLLDTSNSMRAEDIRPNRLDRAKLGLRDLVSRLRGDRIGLIPFAGSSYLYCPLTGDYAAFMMMLNDVRPGLIPRGGTAIEQALRQAARTFDDHLQADRVILLITDGEDHEGNPLDMLDELRRRNIRLFAVGVGTPEGDLIPITDERGQMNFLRDRDGNVVRTSLQEDLLERLAVRTGGMYVRATPTDFGLDLIYEQGIAPLQRDMLESEMILTHEDRFAWFLGLALLLLMLEAALDNRIRFGKKALRAATVMALAALNAAAPVSAETPRTLMKDGLREYQADRFLEAAEAFREAAEAVGESRLDPARAHFNHANALFAQGLHEEAARAYQEALRSTDLTVQQSAHFNRGNALLAMAGEMAQEQQFDTAKAFTEQALDSYRNALTLDPRDHDAKVNFELADRFREELDMILEQQPPPPPQPQPDQDQDQDDQDQDQDDQDQDQQQQRSPEDGDEDESPPQPDDRTDDDQDDGASEGDQAQASDEADGTLADSMDEMTEEEAKMLLDALREEEQDTRDRMRVQLGQPEEVEHNW